MMMESEYEKIIVKLEKLRKEKIGGVKEGKKKLEKKKEKF
jgi:hypothetical protein